MPKPSPSSLQSDLPGVGAGARGSADDSVVSVRGSGRLLGAVRQLAEVSTSEVWRDWLNRRWCVCDSGCGWTVIVTLWDVVKGAMAANVEVEGVAGGAEGPSSIRFGWLEDFFTQSPTGGVNGPVLMRWTVSPKLSSGNLRSVPLAAVVHPLPTFAMNMSGRASMPPSRCRRFRSSRSEIELLLFTSISSVRNLFSEVAVTVIGAQFMYISRSPILLNHVKAQV